MEFKNKNLRFCFKTCKNIFKKIFKNWIWTLSIRLHTIKAQSKNYFEKSPNFCH